MRALSRLLMVVTTTFTIACLPISTPGGGPHPSRNAAVVEVTNNNFEDLVVYWRKGQIDVALGVANGMTTRRFAVPPALLGDGLTIQLAIGARGQRASHASTVFDLPPRAIAAWIVDYRAGLSTVVVR